ncbi:MAG: Nudix family hydrolase [Gammaproteobacteria bacterium]|nr:Nudix family hydrolase [Gammaproteobacteria bacterium]
MNKNSIVHVAVGVLLNDNQEVLIALRPAQSHQGGLWEFPGGKVEEGESVEHALNREFEEELGINVQACTPLIQINHEYSDKSVHLDVWRIEKFSGIPQGREGQAVEWRVLSKLREADFPKANERIIRALNLPELISITPDAQNFGELRDIIQHQLGLNSRLIYFRQKSADEATYLKWFKWAEELCQVSGAKLLYSPFSKTMNKERLPSLRALHLTSQQASIIDSRPVSSEKLFGVSCHDITGLQHAEALDADFAFLSSVSETGKYAESQRFGWDGFKQLASRVNLPVFALGDMEPQDLSTCKSHRGFGIAGISAFSPL